MSLHLIAMWECPILLPKMAVKLRFYPVSRPILSSRRAFLPFRRRSQSGTEPLGPIYPKNFWNAPLVILVAGIAAESFIINRARERAERKDLVLARLARYAGRKL